MFTRLGILLVPKERIVATHAATVNDPNLTLKAQQHVRAIGIRITFNYLTLLGVLTGTFPDTIKFLSTFPYSHKHLKIYDRSSSC